MSCPAVEIENAVYNAIITAGIPSIDAGSTFKREYAERLKTDPARTCVIVVGNEDPKSRTNMTVKIEYPVFVIVSDKVALTIPQSDAWKKETRYALRQLLWKSFLLGSDGIVRGCRYESKPELTALGLTSNLKLSVQLFAYLTEESQTP